jgi:hypothetical protein
MLGVFFSKKIHLLGDSSNNCIVSRLRSRCPQTAHPGSALSWASRVYQECGIVSSKVFHCPRVSGARIAEENGVKESQVSTSFSMYLIKILTTYGRSAAVALHYGHPHARISLSSLIINIPPNIPVRCGLADGKRRVINFQMRVSTGQSFC